MVLKCPKCKLLNPDAAMWCDCGHPFQEGVAPPPIVKPPSKTPTVLVIIGWVFIIAPMFFVGSPIVLVQVLMNPLSIVDPENWTGV